MKADRIISQDGVLDWHQGFLNRVEAARLFYELRCSINWQSRQLRMFGRVHTMPRLIAYFGDLDYAYSGQRHEASTVPSVLRPLIRRMTSITGNDFNSVLLNYYRHGQDSMGWHSDEEACLGPNPAIASLSLGASRPFTLRHKNLPLRHKLLLSDGDLILMSGALQHNWQHALPKTAKPIAARINLTFRHVMP